MKLSKLLSNFIKTTEDGIKELKNETNSYKRNERELKALERKGVQKIVFDKKENKYRESDNHTAYSISHEIDKIRFFQKDNERTMNQLISKKEQLKVKREKALRKEEKLRSKTK